MKIQTLALIISLSLLLISYSTVFAQNQVEYTIQIENNGSATWIIKETGTNITAPPDPLVELSNRVMPLIETAENKTQREMSAEVISYQYQYGPSDSNITIEYVFLWKNFSKVQNSYVIIGDVFQVQDFFLRLYGHGQINMTYPSEYSIEIISPTPNERNDSIQMIKWLRTENLTAEIPLIVLNEKSPSSGFLEILGQNAIYIVALAVLAVGLLGGFYMFKLHKKRTKMIKSPEPSFLGIESDEEKIVKLLKASGGSLYQSAITEQCSFSKAKTSQLLAILENNGTIKRYKKGRDKIVTLNPKDKK